MAIEIVDFPSYNVVEIHSYVTGGYKAMWKTKGGQTSDLDLPWGWIFYIVSSRGKGQFHDFPRYHFYVIGGFSSRE